MPSPRKVKDVSTTMMQKAITINCVNCWHTNAIPISRFYDGFEGEFCCERCGAPLEHVMEEE